MQDIDRKSFSVMALLLGAVILLGTQGQSAQVKATKLRGPKIVASKVVKIVREVAALPRVKKL